MMDHAARVAFIQAQVVCAQAELLGMAAANSQYPEDQPYTKEDFDAVPVKYGIHHNAVIEYLRHD